MTTCVFYGKLMPRVFIVFYSRKLGHQLYQCDPQANSYRFMKV